MPKHNGCWGAMMTNATRKIYQIIFWMDGIRKLCHGDSWVMMAEKVIFATITRYKRCITFAVICTVNWQNGTVWIWASIFILKTRSNDNEIEKFDTQWQKTFCKSYTCLLQMLPDILDRMNFDAIKTITVNLPTALPRYVHDQPFVQTLFYAYHDDIIKWKLFSCYRPFVRGIHRSLVNSPHKSQWRRAFMFSFICTWTKGCANNGDASDLRRHLAHYVDVLYDCFIGSTFPRVFVGWSQFLLTLESIVYSHKSMA